MFSLDGRATLHPAEDIPMTPANPPAQVAAPAVVAEGRRLYEGDCSVCHGPSGRSSGVLPDLRRSGALAERELWRDVVIDGALKDRGMVSFARWLTPAQAETIRAYVGEHARTLQAAETTQRPAG